MKKVWHKLIVCLLFFVMIAGVVVLPGRNVTLAEDEETALQEEVIEENSTNTEVEEDAIIEDTPIENESEYEKQEEAIEEGSTNTEKEDEAVVDLDSENTLEEANLEVEEQEESDDKLKEAAKVDEEEPATMFRSSVIAGFDYQFDVDWAHAQAGPGSEYSYNEENDPEHRHVIFTPTNRDVRTMTVAYGLALNNDGDTELKPGSIKIIIPDYLFEAWGDNYKVHLLGRNGEVGSTVRWQLPKAPETSTVSDFNYIENGDGTYTVTNWKSVSGSAKINFEQAFPFRPHLISVDENGIQKKNFEFKLQIDTNNDGTADIDEVKTLVGELHNNTPKMTVGLKRDDVTEAQGVFFDWQNEWGEKPADADDYFYVVWFADVWRDKRETIPFDFKLSQITPDGEFVGAKTLYYGGRTATITGLNTNMDTSYTNIATENEIKQAMEQPILLKEYGRVEPRRDEDDYFANGFHNDHTYPYNRISILTKHPVSLLTDAKAAGVDLMRDGIKVKNKVEITTALANGVNYTDEAEAEVDIHVYPYSGSWNIEKWDARNRYNGMSQQSGARTYILDNDVAILTERGSTHTFVTHTYGKPISEPKIDPNTGDYIAKKYTVEITEENNVDLDPSVNVHVFYGENKDKFIPYEDGDFTYKSVRITVNGFDAKKSVLGGWTQSSSADQKNTRSDKIDIFTRKLGESDYSLYGTITFSEDGIYNFTSATGDYEVANAKDKVIELPENTVGLKYNYTGAYFRYDFQAKTLMEIQPTDHVKQMLQDKLNTGKGSYFTSAASMVVREEGSDRKVSLNTDHQTVKISTLPLTDIIPNFVFDHRDIGRLEDNTLTGMQAWDRQLRIAQYSSLRDTGKPLGKYLDRYFYKEGNVYLLHPAGTVVNPASFTLYAGYDRAEAHNKLTMGEDYQVDMIPNWQGSGQTMTKIHYVIPDEMDHNYVRYNHTPGIIVRYKLQNSYGNIVDRGNTVLTTAALEVIPQEGEPDLVLLPEKDIEKNLNSLRQKDLFENLPNDNLKYWRFHNAFSLFNPVSVTQSGISKQAANDHTGIYSDTADAFLGNRYSYQIGYTTSSNTRSDKLVFYDILENGSDNVRSEWKGTFDWIDVSSAAQKPTYGNPQDYNNPVVYYATVVPTEFNVDDSSIWKTEMPEDKSMIKAIAIDCRKTVSGADFILDQGMGLNFFIHMVAPKDKTLVDKMAVNQTNSFARNFAGTEAPESALAKEYIANAKVVLHDVNLELHKTSDPETGTQTEPTEISSDVDTPVTYTLKVQNGNDVLDTRNIVLEDTIPNHLIIDTQNIKVKSTALKLNNISYTDVTGLGISVEEQKIVIKIASLPASGDISFIIPTKLDDQIIQKTDFVNTAKITEAEGLIQTITSETTYHRATKQYELNYVVTGDPTYGIPADSVTPDTVTGIDYNTDKSLSAKLTSSQTTALSGSEEVTGTWEFYGWHATEDTTDVITSKNIKKNETVYGNWRFIPTDDITFVKVWRGISEENAAKESVTIKLFKNDVETNKTLTLNSNNSFTGTFSGLERFDIVNGEEVNNVYTIKELTPQGQAIEAGGKIVLNGKTYLVTYENKQVINTLENVKKEVSGSKIWSDSNNQDGKRPTRVTIHLWSDGVNTGKTAIPTSENNWTFTFANLDTYNADGNLINYTVTEDPVDAYTAVINGFNVTNTHVPEKISIPVKKVWVDDEDVKGLRPESVKVRLYAGNTEVGEKTLSAANQWEESFENMDKYSNGSEIAYSIKEDVVNNYTTTYTGEAKTTFTVTNTITGKVTIPVTKKWIGKEADLVTIRLYADGEEIDHKTIGEADQWQYSFEDLDQYKDGKEIKYTISEDELSGYKSKITGDSTGYVITNTNMATKNISVVKKWKVLEGKEVEISLLKDGEEIEKVTIDKEDGFEYTFEDLEVYDKEDGHEYEYAVEETLLAGYEINIEKDQDKGFIITNTYAPKPVAIENVIKKSIKGNPSVKDKFSFELKGLNNSPMPAVTNYVIVGAGEVVTGNIEYTLPGIYEYEITEINAGIKGYEYDKSKFKLTVDVVDEDGSLVASTKIEKDGKETKEILFVNTYKKEENKEVKHEIFEAPLTGDVRSIGGYLFMALASLGLLAGIFYKKLKGNK